MTHDAELHRPFIAVRHVGVRFGPRDALTDINCDVAEGAISVVVGPNGAGKTTLLRVLAGTLAPCSGALAWPRSGTAPRAAFVGQSVALYPFLTVRENCIAAGRMEGLRGTPLTKRVAAVLEQTLCREVERERAGRLSGGYKRRAAVAAALMCDAPLLILDEPSTGLDADGTEAIVATLRGLRAAGKTVVVSTHDFAFADALADRVLFLREGRLRGEGAPRRLCRDLFPSAAHVEIVPARPPEPRQQRLLDELGAYRRSAGLYSLASGIDAGGCPTIMPRLQEAGITLRETRFREPGIGLLFERFCLDRRAS